MSEQARIAALQVAERIVSRDEYFARDEREVQLLRIANDLAAWIEQPQDTANIADELREAMGVPASTGELIEVVSRIMQGESLDHIARDLKSRREEQSA